MKSNFLQVFHAYGLTEPICSACSFYLSLFSLWRISLRSGGRLGPATAWCKPDLSNFKIYYRGLISHNSFKVFGKIIVLQQESIGVLVSRNLLEWSLFTLPPSGGEGGCWRVVSCFYLYATILVFLSLHHHRTRRNELSLTLFCRAICWRCHHHGKRWSTR